MTGRQLAVLLGPLLGPGARDRLRALAIGAVSNIALRYDEVVDFHAMHRLLVAHVDDVQFYDGEEWFLVELEGAMI